MGRPISDEDREDLRKRLLDGVGRVFAGDPGNTLAGQPVPQFLAGPPPGDPFGDFQHRSGRAACDRWARGDRASLLPGRDLFYRNLCEPYLGDGMPGEPTTEPPFLGGQCPVRYSYVVDRFGADGVLIGSGPTSCNAQHFGPIGTFNRPNPPGPGFVAGVTYFTALGVPREAAIISGPEGVRVSPRNFVKCLGGPDDCGNPPDEFDPGDPNPSPDPNPGPVGGPVGYPFPGFDIEVNPDGTINVDFGDEPPTEIDPGNPGDGGGGGGAAPTSPGFPGESGDTGVGGEAAGEAGEGEELTGVLVRVLVRPENANKFDNTPFDVLRGAGYVAMGYPGLLGIDPTASVLNSPQFFHAQQRGLTAWRVRANIGFNLETTPYYREIEQ